MITTHSRVLKAFGILSAMALGLTLTAPAMAMARHGEGAHARPKPPMEIAGLVSTGEVADVLSSTEFVLTTAKGDALAVNLTSSTTIVNDTTATQSSSSGTTTTPAVTTGEYATVTYHFDAQSGAVASRVVLSTSPLPTGPARQVRGMISAVGTGTFTLEDANGVSFTIDVLPTTLLRWIETGAGTAPTATPAVAVGDFASVSMRSTAGVNDAVQVIYSNAPVGIHNHSSVLATVTGISGNVLALQMKSGGSLDVTVLPSAIIELNGQAASLSQIAAGDSVHLQGVRFVGVYYATTVVATSTASNG